LISIFINFPKRQKPDCDVRLIDVPVSFSYWVGPVNAPIDCSSKQRNS
jgi:hypothetical protein